MEARTSKSRGSKSGLGSTRTYSSRKERKSKRSTTNTLRSKNSLERSSESVDATSATLSEPLIRGNDRATEVRTSPRPTDCSLYVVGAIHVIDFGLGTACIVYGGMVHVVSVTATFVSFGLMLGIGSVAGAIGCCRGKGMKSRGVLVSALAGIIACLCYIAACVTMLKLWDTFLEFLRNSSEALLLNEASVDVIHDLKIPLVVIFLCMASLEMYRGVVMFRMKTEKSSNIIGRRRSRIDSISVNGDSRPNNWFLSWLGVVKRKRTDDLIMFDDNSSLDSALLWSHSGEPRPADYLEFAPEHERRLTDFTATLSLPIPPEDKLDY